MAQEKVYRKIKELTEALIEVGSVGRMHRVKVKGKEYWFECRFEERKTKT